MAYRFDCKYFSGYKPCQFKRECDGCDNYDGVQHHIVIVSLEALGAVLRSTCLLEPIKRKYPSSHITWITMPAARPLLAGNPLIDRLIGYDGPSVPLISYLQFDVLFAVDKSEMAGALAETISAKDKFGFGLTKTGKIRPFNMEANYQFSVGLDDQLKFFDNEKTETQQITESMALPWQRDEYLFRFSKEEQQGVEQLRLSLRGDALGIIGYNTGCSTLYPYKKLTVAKSIELIRQWRQQFPQWKVLMLGGREDVERQRQIKLDFVDDPFVIDAPAGSGLRAGMQWMAASDLVFSGCSLGLHMAIALKKPAVAWFGVSCPQEIDLYQRGEKVLADVACRPCWKKSCNQPIKCFNQVSIDKVCAATKKVMALTESKQINPSSTMLALPKMTPSEAPNRG